MAVFRRRIALLAAFAVLATALWPLATSLGYAANGEAMPLCHMAGMQVAADSMPMPMPESGDHAPAPRQHCPLCVMVFFGAFAPELAAPPYIAIVVARIGPPIPEPLARRFVVVLPGSRAPPAISLA